MSRRALVVAYCFPPHAAIGTHRALRLVSHLASTGWQVDVLTADERTYLPGTPVDHRLLGKVPESVRVFKAGAFRGWTALGRAIGPFKQRLRGRQAGNGASSAPAEYSVTASHPGRLRELKTLIEEL